MKAWYLICFHIHGGKIQTTFEELRPPFDRTMLTEVERRLSTLFKKKVTVMSFSKFEGETKPIINIKSR